MGIPKFFRWCAERYPTIITPFTDSAPPIDNLYIDMNGIIHVCARSNATDVASRHMSEEAIVRAVFAYLDRIFTSVQPRKHFVMAVDGVAPRAKMNQQRQRRFRKIIDKELETKENQGLEDEDGEKPPHGEEFDSNCITPGTTFMVRISEHLEYFINFKMQTHAAWRSCKIIYSGHQDPGEGEHKIMSFIRNRKMEANYCPNETHCMYGLDADLMMLSLAAHEPNFVLLREVVQFGMSFKERSKLERDEERGITQDKSYESPSGFVLLHISLLREYLYMDLKPRNLERCIDDFVFMCFFVGNDFLPALPSLNIGDGALTELFEIYQRVFIAEGVYLTNQKQINWEAVQRMFQEIGKKEWSMLTKRMREAARRDKEAEEEGTLVGRSRTFDEYKRLYYNEKLEFRNHGRDVRELARAYLEGLNWVMEYYYDGCVSWGWYFPYHYAPLASDMHEVANLARTIRFELGKPFTPHQQLLAVLPPASHKCVPTTYWDLMLNNSSPLKPFCPEPLDVKIDREGARAQWEGVVCLPFLNEDVLLQAYESVASRLPDNERRNNQRLPTYVYVYEPFSSSAMSYKATLPNFPNLPHCKVKRYVLDVPDGVHFNAALCPGVKLFSNPVEGFGTLGPHIPNVSSEIRGNVVKVFGSPSRQPSLIVTFDRKRATEAKEVTNLIGQEVMVGYPHMKRAIITSICDWKSSYYGKFDSNLKLTSVDPPTVHNEREERQFQEEAKRHSESLLSTCGCDLNGVDVLVYVRRVTGMRWDKKGKPQLTFASAETVYPLQLVVLQEEYGAIPDGRFSIQNVKVEDLRVGTDVVYLPDVKQCNEHLYGCVGLVDGITQRPGQSSLYSLMLGEKHTTTEEELSRIPSEARDYATKNNWFSVSQVAAMLEMPARGVTSIAGNIRSNSMSGNRELGLNMLNTYRNFARVGYTKKVRDTFNPWYVAAPNLFAVLDDQTGSSSSGTGGGVSGHGTWYFSSEAIKILKDFVSKFRPFVRAVAFDNQVNLGAFDPMTMLVDEWAHIEVVGVMDRIQEYVAELPYSQRLYCSAFDDVLPYQLIEKVESAIDTAFVSSAEQRESANLRRVRVNNVPLSHIYVPIMITKEGTPVSLPLPAKTNTNHSLLDRVVYCSSAGSVPLGARGTVVRILADGKHVEVIMDEEHIGCNTLSGRLKTNRGAILKKSALLIVASENVTNAATTPQTNPTAVGLPPVGLPSVPPVTIMARPQTPSSGGTPLGNTAAAINSNPSPASAEAARKLGIRIGGADPGSPEPTSVSPLVLPSANKTPFQPNTPAGTATVSTGRVTTQLFTQGGGSASTSREPSVTDFFKATRDSPYKESPSNPSLPPQQQQQQQPQQQIHQVVTDKLVSGMIGLLKKR
eukprot:PhF_6_TR27972/c1_g1_i1/m.41384/K12618/XRN1, SEP1, KEM1; 5'-3' exoribonuclease 1